MPRILWASQMALMVKNLPTSAGDRRDMSLIPAKILRRRAWQPTPVSCLENPMDRGVFLVPIASLKSGVKKEDSGLELSH